MDHPIEFDSVPDERPLFFSDVSSSVDLMADAAPQQDGLYQEIAERRAQLECAETLRRVRAL
jgi:hypothetical protein